MNYQPAPVPSGLEALRAYILRELQRVAAAFGDAASTVVYRTDALQVEISANNMTPQGIERANVLLLSSSITQTITGLIKQEPGRLITLINIGTGTVVLNNNDAASSNSNRIVIYQAAWQVSANASVTLWRDGSAARWRAIYRT